MKNFKDSKLTEIMPKMFKKIQQPENNKRKPIQKYSKSNKKRQGQKHNPIKTVILITYLFQMSDKDSFFFLTQRLTKCDFRFNVMSCG